MRLEDHLKRCFPRLFFQLIMRDGTPSYVYAATPDGAHIIVTLNPPFKESFRTVAKAVLDSFYGGDQCVRS